MDTEIDVWHVTQHMSGWKVYRKATVALAFFHQPTHEKRFRDVAVQEGEARIRSFFALPPLDDAVGPKPS